MADPTTPRGTSRWAQERAHGRPTAPTRSHGHGTCSGVLCARSCTRGKRRALQMPSLMPPVDGRTDGRTDVRRPRRVGRGEILKSAFLGLVRGRALTWSRQIKYERQIRSFRLTVAENVSPVTAPRRAVRESNARARVRRWRLGRGTERAPGAVRTRRSRPAEARRQRAPSRAAAARASGRLCGALATEHSRSGGRAPWACAHRKSGRSRGARARRRAPDVKRPARARCASSRAPKRGRTCAKGHARVRERGACAALVC